MLVIQYNMYIIHGTICTVQLIWDSIGGNCVARAAVKQACLAYYVIRWWRRRIIEVGPELPGVARGRLLIWWIIGLRRSV